MEEGCKKREKYRKSKHTACVQRGTCRTVQRSSISRTGNHIDQAVDQIHRSRNHGSSHQFNLCTFVSTEDGEEVEGFSGVDSEDDDWDDDTYPDTSRQDNEYRLGNGIINFLKEGEKVEAVESKHPSGNYDGFVTAFTTMIGAALEISPEVLMKKFTNNFSASKGALNETWRHFSTRRKWFIDDFCNVRYINCSFGQCYYKF